MAEALQRAGAAPRLQGSARGRLVRRHRRNSAPFVCRRSSVCTAAAGGHGPRRARAKPASGWLTEPCPEPAVRAQPSPRAAAAAGGVETAVSAMLPLSRRRETTVSRVCVLLISPPSLSMLRLHPLHPCPGPMSCEGFDSIRPSQPKRCSDRSSEEGTARRAEGVLRLDRSTVWAETAVSSRFLHMALTRGIDEVDAALTWIC